MGTPFGKVHILFWEAWSQEGQDTDNVWMNWVLWHLPQAEEALGNPQKHPAAAFKKPRIQGRVQNAWSQGAMKALNTGVTTYISDLLTPTKGICSSQFKSQNAEEQISSTNPSTPWLHITLSVPLREQRCSTLLFGRTKMLLPLQVRPAACGLWTSRLTLTGSSFSRLDSVDFKWIAL